jgi:(4S)-4-hydroxy-5-phosphonooxypentane-2,3-dione isomerase
MANFVLIVEFELKPGSVASFLPLIAENARASVTQEPGCLQFDVVQLQDDPSRILLYEVYADAAAFDAHRAMPHVATFFAAAKEMIAHQTVRRMARVSAAGKQ